MTSPEKKKIYNATYRAAHPQVYDKVYQAEYREKNRERKRAYDKNRHAADPQRYSASYRDRSLKTKYGITSEEYNLLLESQGGVCKICGTEPGDQALAVDHCHESSRVRGLLCTQCNLGIGMFKDDSSRLLAAISYLETNEPASPVYSGRLG